MQAARVAQPIGPHSRRLVRLCYRLDQCARYRRWKDLSRDLLENERSRRRRYFDGCMIALVLASVVALVYDVKHGPHLALQRFEAFAIAVFVLEYLARGWVCSDSRRIVIEHFERTEFLRIPFRPWAVLGEVLASKWRYASSPMAVVDLLAILPGLRGLRFLRIFLLFRIFKLFRYTGHVAELAKVIGEKRFELATLGLFTSSMVFAASVAIYLVEGGGQDHRIQTLFDAVYWSVVTVSTVGYGDISPASVEGRIIAMALIVTGIGVISFSTSIMVAGFSGKLRLLHDQRVYAQVLGTPDLVVLCGYGRVGELVAANLASAGDRFVVIERDAALAERARERGHLVLHADATHSYPLEQVGLRERARTVLCLTSDDVVNVFITLSVRHMSPGSRVIARANSDESARKLRLAGANHVVTPFEVVGLTAAEYVGQPVAFEAIRGLMSGTQEVGVEAILVLPGSYVDGVSVGDIDFTAMRLILFGVVTTREDDSRTAPGLLRLAARQFYFNPPPRFVVRADEFLVVFGAEYSIRAFREDLERSVLRVT